MSGDNEYLQHPIDQARDLKAHPILRAYFEINHLKDLYRQGWLKRGIPPQACESVAEHTLGVAVLTWWLADAFYPELDREHMIRMALLHDFGEVHAGDVTPSDGVSQAEKHRLERESVERVFAGLPQGEAYMKLWQEYETGATPEARLVRQADRLEMALQAAIYAGRGYGDLGEFFDSAEQVLSDPQLRDMIQVLRQAGPPLDGAKDRGTCPRAG